MTVDRIIANEPTLPRRNGELVFDTPWESRAFGLAVALSEAGLVEWEHFRTRLVEKIQDWERESPGGERWSYYERWHDTLERLLVDSGVVTADELAREADAIAHERAHDHEH